MRGLVLIAAGGTGGHLFPAEALAQAMTARGWRVHLATDRRTEAYGHAFPAEEIHLVSSATLTRSPAGVVRGLAKLALGLLEARRLARRLRPDVAIGFGGYPTVPPMLAAAWAGVPTIIHEQNAVLGRANRFLAARVDCIATSVPGLGGTGRGRVVETGNPVRPAAREAAKIPYPARTSGDPFRLLVVGGSQGARFLSDLVPPAVARLPRQLESRLRIVQQCRPEDMDRVGEAYRSMEVTADLAPFFGDLPQRMAASHLVVCRSGASTCAELSVIGRPAIMVPLPGALDQDQKANAQVLAKAGGGWMVEQRDMTPERLAADLTDLVGDPHRLAAAAAALRAIARPDAVERLADLVERVATHQAERAGASALA
jgi:UDP-N-acetylglucosamine--N-acetylmuramyl-(pentapeptide) pyrophosphoryl-undecaprenol N-acetylglucosamine transferase